MLFLKENDIREKLVINYLRKGFSVTMWEQFRQHQIEISEADKQNVKLKGLLI